MIEFDKEGKISQLKAWALTGNIDDNKLLKIFKMLELGKRSDRSKDDPVQFPHFYCQDDNALSWHDPSKHSWVKLLEDNFEPIKKEASRVFENNLMNIHPENNELACYGNWNIFFFYKNGIKYLDNHLKCPFTSSIIDKITGTEIAGRTYFSMMPPGIHIKAHCGPHNFKLRTHLGIVTPKEATIRVASEERDWIEGKCIVFDDSFEHEVWNKSSVMRIVLIVDVWNPSLTKLEIQALEYIMQEFYHPEEVLSEVTV